MYQSIVNRCFAEIAAVSLPTGDVKEESIAYARVLIERGCSSNCCHSEYICNATSRQALSRKRKDSHKHIPECPIDGKKQSIDRYQSILMVSFNLWSIDNHRKAFNQEPTLCVRMEKGMVRVKCHAQAQHNVPGQASNAGVECSYHEATSRVKFNELSWINSPIQRKGRQTNQNGGLTVCWLIFLCGNAGHGKERNAVQATWRLFQNRCFSSPTLRYKCFQSFPVHLQIAFWNDFLYHLIRSLYLINF